MRNIIIVGIILITGISLAMLNSCDGDDGSTDVAKELPALFKFKDNLATKGNEKVAIEIEINESIKKLELFFNDSVIKTWLNPKDNLKYELDAGIFGVGTRTLNLLSTLNDGSTFVDNRMVRVLSDIIPEKQTVEVVNEYAHLTTSFTQGLEFYKGKLYEGTGDPGGQGKSLVAEIDYKTGQHIKSIGLSAGFFGEGITIMEGIVYQLTWKNQKCYTYSIEKDLQLVGEYNYAGEGWGLCNDGKSLIMSNGTERIVYRNPKTFEIERTLEVYNNQGPISYLNELEYIDGKIYANVWTTNIVVVIDPETGKVLKEIDASGIVALGKGNGEVLNGIAYDSTTGKTFMTGKYWYKLLEVKFRSPGV